MTSSKESARDLRYGRQAGRWAGIKADEAIAEIHRVRLASIGADNLKTPAELEDPRNRSWPIESLALWREIAKQPDHPAYERALEVVAVAGR